VTKIDTDNPIVEYWVTCCDFIWQHLPVLSIVLLVALVFIYIWFKHWQKGWDEKMLNDKRTWEEHMKELKVDTLSRKSDIDRQLYEGDVVEIKELKQVKGL